MPLCPRRPLQAVVTPPASRPHQWECQGRNTPRARGQPRAERARSNCRQSWVSSIRPCHPFSCSVQFLFRSRTFAGAEFNSRACKVSKAYLKSRPRRNACIQSEGKAVTILTRLAGESDKNDKDISEFMKNIDS